MLELNKKKVDDYDQEISRLQTADKPEASWEKATQKSRRETPGRQTKQSTQLFLPHQDDYKTRIDTK